MKRKISLFFLFFCLVLILSACELKKDSDKNDWENEVLWADECGQDGLACCIDQEPSCKFGQVCCVSPLDPKDTYCADECRFGELDEFCRDSDDSPCDSSLVCADYGRCAPCGDAEMACCTGQETCNGELICNSGICEECGLPGNICCKGEQACQDEKSRDETRTECQINDICSFCGSAGQIACQQEPFCNAGNLFNNQSCYRCGGPNQPCCKDGEETYCDKGLSCGRGFCS